MPTCDMVTADYWVKYPFVHVGGTANISLKNFVQMIRIRVYLFTPTIRIPVVNLPMNKMV